jgi:hypothetical protein
MANEAAGKEKRRLDQRRTSLNDATLLVASSGRNPITCFIAFSWKCFLFFARFPRRWWPSPTNGTSFPPDASEFEILRRQSTGPSRSKSLTRIGRNQFGRDVPFQLEKGGQ